MSSAGYTGTEPQKLHPNYIKQLQERGELPSDESTDTAETSFLETTETVEDETLSTKSEGSDLQNPSSSDGTEKGILGTIASVFSGK